MKTLLHITLLILLSVSAFASATSFSISGTIVDSTTGATIEVATVSVKLAGSEKIVSAVTADINGNFSIEQLKPDKYLLTVSYIGYVSKTMPVEVKANVNLGKIPLAINSKTLSETVVTSDKAVITKNSEKTVINVAQSPSNQVGTAEDVLRNMPGVMVDQKGSVSIVGKQGVKILVDDKPNALAQSDLPSFLKSIPANSIEAIELVTNPSAKYEAEGSAGIINIKLKKGKNDGLNGSVSAGYGILNHYNGSANINWKKNKINLFGGYSINPSQENNEWIEHRNISLNDTATTYNFHSKGTENHLTHGFKAGLDYFINNKNTLSYTASGAYSRFKWFSDAMASNLDALQNKIASYNSLDDEISRNFSIMNDVAYQHKFDSTEHELNADISYTYVSGSHDALLNSMGYDSAGVYSPANSLQRRTESLNNIHNINAQLDYSYPIKKWAGYKFEGGLKNETTFNKNIFNAYNITNNIEYPDSLLSNHFNYLENIAAAYVVMSGGYKKLFSYSAGLRAEHTFITSNNNTVNRDYLSFFPSATFTAEVGTGQTLSASYSRRVQRPQFRQINNTISYIDQYSTWQGNSFLQPSFSHIVSLNYSLMVKQHMFSLEAKGNFQSNGFMETSRIDSERITRGGVANDANSKTFNLTFFTKLQLTKWWDLQMSHTYTYIYYGFKQDVNTSPVFGSSYNLWLNTSIKFWKNTVFETGGWFNSKGVQSQGIALPVGGWHASIKKSFLKDRLTASVAAQNILNTLKWGYTVTNLDLQSTGSWQQYNRVVMFTLTYRFGSNTHSPERKEKEANERLGGGGAGR